MLLEEAKGGLPVKYEEPSVVIPELEAAPLKKRRYWTEEEKATLFKYRDRDPKALAAHFGRSVAGVRAQLEKMDGGGACGEP